MAIILLHILLLFLSITVQSAENSISKPGCPDSCGGIPIPFPFGIGDKCSLSYDFNVTCDANINRKPTPYLYGGAKYGFEIVHISILLGQARFKLPIHNYQCYDNTTNEEISYETGYGFDETPYMINNEKNIFMVTGCNTFASLTFFDEYESSISVGCLSTCNSIDILEKYGPSCSGIGCCHTAFPVATNFFLLNFDERKDDSQMHNFSHCSYAMIVEDGFQFNIDYVTTDKLREQKVPIILDWIIGNKCKAAQTNKSSYACKSDHSVCIDYKNGPGYRCNCCKGYEGNPYLPGGCQDIDECTTQNPCPGQARCINLPGTYNCSAPKCAFGTRNRNNMCKLNSTLVIGSCATLAALLFLGFALYITMERRNLSKVKERYFQEYGGWILLEKIKSNQGFGFILFTKQQVEQATDNFDHANIIGHGGHGIVFKGTLRDQTVAIKKCKIVDESKKKEFGKEMLILSQVSHKNIVKLLGCCLEVDVPMLVYEFIPNGTLHQFIHHKKPAPCIPLATRLRIANESAEALSYLHTSASPPIYHGDVKSANILLDKNYSAKVSDFGASILAPTNGEAQVVTFVQGILGYLDPEYLQTHQLTNKSDVYSFGVVLLELLTSKLVIDFGAPEEERSLSARFIVAMKENKLHELLDDEIVYEEDMESIEEVAELAMGCLHMKGEERPTMKMVAEELHRIRKLKQHPWKQGYHPEETTILLGEGSCREIELDLSSYCFNADKEAEESIALGR